MKKVYELLSKTKKTNSWWPAQDPYEIAVGAILTQATSWSNVEKSIKILKEKDLLNPLSILSLDRQELGKLVKSSLYYNQKARKLKEFTTLLKDEYQMSMKQMKKQKTSQLRKQLLGVWGIGDETADSILLYALDHHVFVIDAYTKRLFSRLGITTPDIEYNALQKIFHKKIVPDALHYKHYHGLIVDHSKNICTKNKPCCEKCVLEKICNKNF